MANSNVARRMRGFTLLELLLALALTGLVLYVISMAVDLNMRAFHKRRSSIEQAQLARTLLRIIADDIRGSVAIYEQDMSGIEKLLADSAASAASGALDEAGVEDLDMDLDLDALLEEETSNTVDLAAGATLPTKPGIYGNQYEIQMDVSRLPRVEEYQQLLAVDPAIAMLDLPSDVKTVTYFVQDQGFVQNQGATAFDAVPDLGVVEENGLVRREMDRSVTQWALENGNVAGMQLGDVIAPEVVGLELSYFDGYEWRTEWDSEVESTLPMAIQVVLVLKPPADPATADPSAAAMLDEASLKYYRAVIRIPTGRPVEEEVEEEMTETDPSTEEGA